MGKSSTEQNRERYRTVAFRMSDDELLELDARIKLSGRDKQDYLIKSTLYQTIIVIGNRVQFEALSTCLTNIQEKLVSLEKASDLDAAILLPIRSAIEIISGFTDSERPWDDSGMTFAQKNADSDEYPENSNTKIAGDKYRR